MHPAEWWGEQDVEVRTGTEVAAIDPGAHTVTLADGETVEYGRLALATGATPRTLPGHVQHPHDRRLRRRWRARLEAGPGHLGVIGGGFIGVEAAASARMKGWDVTMAVPEAVVWEHLFGAEVGRLLPAPAREATACTVHTGTKELPDGQLRRACWPGSASRPTPSWPRPPGSRWTTACTSTST